MTSRCSTAASHASRGAFTLLEVLLALFVFSLAVISLVEAINSTGRTAMLSRRERQVQARLESLLVEATHSPEFLAKVRTGEPQESTLKEGDMTFITRARPLELKNEDEQPLVDLFVVNVTATWKEGRDSQEVTAETWVFPPLFQPRQQR